jgi:hypothetical protein
MTYLPAEWIDAAFARYLRLYYPDVKDPDQLDEITKYFFQQLDTLQITWLTQPTSD